MLDAHRLQPSSARMRPSMPGFLSELGIWLWFAFDWMNELCGPEWPRIFNEWLWQHRGHGSVTVSDLRRLAHRCMKSAPMHRTPRAYRYGVALDELFHRLESHATRRNVLH